MTFDHTVGVNRFVLPFAKRTLSQSALWPLVYALQSNTSFVQPAESSTLHPSSQPGILLFAHNCTLVQAYLLSFIPSAALCWCSCCKRAAKHVGQGGLDKYKTQSLEGTSEKTSKRHQTKTKACSCLSHSETLCSMLFGENSFSLYRACHSIWPVVQNSTFAVIVNPWRACARGLWYLHLCACVFGFLLLLYRRHRSFLRSNQGTNNFTAIFS